RRRVENALRGRPGDVLEVHRLPLDQTSEADDCVETARLGRPLRRQRNLEGAGDVDDINLVIADRRGRERLARAGQQSRRHLFIEAGDDNGEAQAGSGLRTGDFHGFPCARTVDPRLQSRLVPGAYRPLNSGFRFSRKALVPSRMSSVDATSPNNVASRNCPLSKETSRPRLTASMMYCIAIGAFDASSPASAR